MDTHESPITTREGQATVSASSGWYVKSIVAVGIVLVVIVGVGGYLYFIKGAPAVTSMKHLYSGTITMGYTPWPGYVGLFVAKDKGYFKDAGLNVELKEYPGLTEISKAYVNGETQVRGNLTLDAVDEAYSGLDHRVIAAIDYSSGSDGIIAKSQIKTMRDARGKKVAFEKGTLEEFFLRYALEQNDMTLADIIGVDLDPESAAQALVDNKVDVAVTFEPFMADALKKVSGNKIYSSADAPGLITDILTFREDFIEQNPDTVDAFIQAYFRGIDSWKANAAEADVITGKYLGISGDDAASQLEGVNVLDQRDNQNAFTFAAGFQSLYGNMRRVNDFIREQHYHERAKIDTDKLIDDRFIKKLAQ